MSFNKVDEALRSVGITLQTTDHQFRDFTDVILELADKWDTLDSAQQRYIATQFAGNRQQSRFLALVSNADLLRENLDNALNSEDVGTLQALKSLDSLESKINQVQVAYQQFYTTIGIENVWKALLDSTKNVIDTLNSLPKLFNKIPLGALAAITNVISLIKTVLFSGLRVVSAEWEKITNNTKQVATEGGKNTGENWVKSTAQAVRAGAPEIQSAMEAALGQSKSVQPKANIDFNNISGTNEEQAEEFRKRLEIIAKQGVKFTDDQTVKLKELEQQILRNEISITDAGIKANQIINNVAQDALEEGNKVLYFFNALQTSNSSLSRMLTVVSQGLTTLGMLINKDTRAGQQLSGVITGLGGGIQTASAAIRVFSSHGLDIKAWSDLLTGVLNLANGLGLIIETDAEKLDRLTKEAEELSNIAKQEKANYNTLQRSIDKLEELKKKRYDSAESAEEYQNAINDLADSFPQLIIGFDEAGNAILNTKSAEQLLAEAREKSAQATIDALHAEREKTEQEQKTIYNDIAEDLSSMKSLGLTELPEVTGNIVEDLNKAIEYNVETLDELIPDTLGAYDLSTILKNVPAVFKENRVKDVVDAALNPTLTLADKGTPSDDAAALIDEFYAILNFKPEDLAKQENLQRIERFSEQINELRNQNDDYWNFLFDTNTELGKKWSNILTNIKKIQPIESINKNLQRQEISQTLAKNYQELNSLQNQFATDLLINDKELDYEAAVTTVNSWWENFEEGQAELLETIFQNLPNYSLSNIYSLLEITDTQSEFAQVIAQQYAAQVDNVTESLQNQLENAGLNIKSEAFESDLGLAAITNATKLLLSYEERGFTDNAENIHEAATEIFSILSQLAENSETTQQAIELLSILKDGFSTKEQIETVIEKIQAGNFGKVGNYIISQLDIVSTNLIENYLLNLQTALDANNTRYSTSSKTFSSLSKGLEINEVFDFLTGPINTALNEDSRLTLDDFKVNAEGLMALTDERRKEFWQDYLNAVYTIPQEASDFKRVLDGLSKNATVDELSVEELAHLGLTKDATPEQLQAAVDTYKKDYALLEKQVKAMKSASIAQLSFDIGDYSALGSPEAFAAEVARGVDVKRDDPILQAGVKTASEALSSYFSAVMEKGIEKVDASLYALPKEVPEVTNLIDLVAAYKDFYGEYSEEYNALMVQAIEKDAERTTGAARDAFKDINFIRENVAYASLETIQKLADIFNISIEKLFDATSFNSALGGYKLNVDTLDLSGIVDAQNLVVESIQQNFETIAELIGQGLSGELSFEGKDNLVALLNQYDINLDLMFTQTAEGLKLSSNSAIALYSNLKQVDSLRADLVFDEMVEHFTEAGEECENLSSTLANIKRLENELAQAENKGNKELENRLDLYRRIAQQQTTDPNQFKFMDRDLPTGMQSPENYWNAVGKAYTSMNEAASSGYMSIQDYYNIVNEMANLVTLSNGELEWMGMTSANAQEKAAELMREGMQALANVDGKGVQISMTELANKFGIGVDQMSKGFDEGIKVMAKEQIKVLDAQIMMLEAIVAMEDLGSIDVDGNGIDDSDIFVGGFGNLVWDEKRQAMVEQYTQQYQDFATNLLKQSETNEALAKSLEQIKIDGVTLKDLFDDATDGIKDINISSEALVAAIQAFWDGTQSLDWNEDSESLEAFVARFGSSFFPEGTVIDITPNNGEPPFKLVFSSSGVAQLEIEEDGVTYDGQHYDSVEEATKVAVDKMNQEAAEAASGESEVEVKQTVWANIKTTVKSAMASVDEAKDKFLGFINKNGTANVNTTEQKTIQVNLDYGTFPTGLKDLIEAAKTGLERALNITTTPESSVDINVNGIITNFKEASDVDFAKTYPHIAHLIGNIDFFYETDKPTIYTPILKTLEGIITEYNETGDKDTLTSKLTNLNTLTGAISEYINGGQDDPNKLVSALKAYVSNIQYAEGLNAENALHLLDLIAIVKTLTGIGDAADSQAALDLVEMEAEVATIAYAGKNDKNSIVQGLHATADLAAEDVTLPELSLTPTLDSTQLDKGFEEWLAKTGGVQFNPTTGQVTAKNDLETGAQIIFDSLDKGTQAFLQTIDPANIPSSEEMYGPFMDATEDAATKVDENRKAQEKHTIKTNESTRATALNSVSLKAAAKSAIQAGKDFLTSTKSLDKIGTNVTSVTTAESGLAKSLNRLGQAVENAVTAINAAIKRISTGPTAAKGTRSTGSGKTPIIGSGSKDAHYTVAKGNFANARGTLMGELGEELYVTDGHYYVAGANGPEFVNLPDDAIVFNHLQTKRLLQNGSISTHGKPVTNERKATSYAAGNMEGIALASARSALARLYEIRDMWQALLNADLRSLGALAGSGRGGSGGGGGSSNDAWDMKSYTAEIQRWYNLLRQISALENQITHQETLRSKLASDLVPNGRAIYNSQKASLQAIHDEIVAQKQLLILQQSYYDNARKDLENSEYAKIFEFGENGILQYKGTGEKGSGEGLDILEQLQRRDVYGQAIDNAETAQKQIDYLRAQGFDISKLIYNDDGSTLANYIANADGSFTLTDNEGKTLEGEELQEAQMQMLENFFNNVSSFQDEMDGLYDNIQETSDTIIELESSKNEILREIRDNQIQLENQIRDAIVEREQRRIDAAKDERDALKESMDDFINGLSNELSKERQMYNANREEEDLNKLRRRLAILQRSGGSSFQIRSLQQEIDSKTQEAYFNEQQQQIDAIKEASDLEIARLDKQIEIMEETLDYSRAEGLFWSEVTQVMSGSTDSIASFISKYTSEYNTLSAAAFSDKINELSSSIQQWIARRDDPNPPDDTNTDNGGGTTTTPEVDTAKLALTDLGMAPMTAEEEQRYVQTLAETGDDRAAFNELLQSRKDKSEQAETTTTGSNNSPEITGSGTESATIVEDTNPATVYADELSTLPSPSTIVFPTSDLSAFKGQRNTEYTRAIQLALAALGYSINDEELSADNGENKIKGYIGATTLAALSSFRRDNGLRDTRPLQDYSTKMAFKGKGYSEGGLVDYTGLAMVHGTPNKPESFLNAQDTQLLKEDVLAQRTILPDLLEAYQMIHNFNGVNRTPVSTDTSSGLTIQNLDLHLDIKSMNSDYDARRAAEQIADNLMNIARKSGNISLNRG